MTREECLQRAELCFELESQFKNQLRKASMRSGMWYWLFRWAEMPA